MFIFPYNRDNSVEDTPWVVVGLIVINSALLVLSWFAGPTETLFMKYGFTPAHPQIFTAFTSMFLHAGFWHLFGNMWFLWMFGNQVENILGRWQFCLVYLVCGFGGDFLHYLFNSTSTIPLVGASGAISGIAGCFFVLYPKANFDLVFYFRFWVLKTIHTYTSVAVGAWIAEQALLGVLSLKFQSFSVAFWGHVGGFAVGLVAGGLATLLMPKRKKVVLRRARHRSLQTRVSQTDESLHLKS
ncbi:MAG: rhomboid family intramembrane serine protease [Acidobacteria bacterium]|nr:MAG: rhomboid family intramembrane serine protease [Acidobacteriota bacterium]